MKPGQGRIVVGVDGSVASVAALRWAETEAIARQAELDAVYAWDEALQPRAPYADCVGAPDLEQDRAAAAAVLASSVRMALGPDPAVPLKTEVVEGHPERVLLDRAQGAELLVLGSTVQPGLQAEASPIHQTCLRKAACPVLIVSPS
jgi:nucleotide-binding universal stress UspA family protein